MEQIKNRVPWKEPIWVHSMFRTGSTWYWNKFRNLTGCRAYYEPFNEALSQVTPEDVYDDLGRQSLRHPTLSKPYFWEYPKLDSGGVPGYLPRFAYEGYMMEFDRYDPDLRNYLWELVQYAQDQGEYPVFGFCRSSLRSRWIYNQFPGTHVYLVRDPRKQWESYCSYVVNTEFVPSVLAIFSLNGGIPERFWGKDSVLVPTMPRASLPEIRASVDNGFLEYGISDPVDPVELYVMFYTLWLASLLENVQVCDLIIDMDRLSLDLEYRLEVEKVHRNMGLPVDLSDCQTPQFEGGRSWGLDCSAIELGVESVMVQHQKEWVRNSIHRTTYRHGTLGPYTQSILDRVRDLL